jgi:lycopene cyclase domain-containing protein
MTYLQFLLIFLGIPLFMVLLGYRKSKLPHKKEFRFGIMLLIFLAVTYTTPWDNYLVKTGVWIYGEDRIIGTIGYVPIEEYCFFVLQTILSGLICFLLQKQIPLIKKNQKIKLNKIVMIGYAFFFFVGVVCLYFEKTRYLGLILSWAMPVILLQWTFGGNYLLTNSKLFLLSTFIPTFYLWIADGLAISWGIWSISEVFTIGVNLGSLPLEEAVFFLVTNLMVSQGVILFVVMQAEIAKVKDLKRRVFKWAGITG